jgi:hypothetical protein
MLKQIVNTEMSLIWQLVTETFLSSWLHCYLTKDSHICLPQNNIERKDIQPHPYLRIQVMASTGASSTSNTVLNCHYNYTDRSPISK